MSDKAWKAWERTVAKIFGTKRRGPMFRNEDGGTDDCTHAWYAIECKLLSRPTFGQLLDACRQAEGAAMVTRCVEIDEAEKSITLDSTQEREPIAIVKRKGDRMEDALVIQRLATFRAWHL